MKQYLQSSPLIPVSSLYSISNCFCDELQFARDKNIINWCKNENNKSNLLFNSEIVNFQNLLSKTFTLNQHDFFREREVCVPLYLWFQLKYSMMLTKGQDSST